jgi:hypothetical protein
MNERMLTLYAQAQVPCTATDPSNGMPYETTCFSANKFAELIVKECAKVVDIWSDEVPCSEGYDKFTVGKLKEHFGVE